MGDFLLVKRNTAIKTYSENKRPWKMEKIKNLSEDIYKFVKKFYILTFIKYYLKWIHNPQTLMCTTKLATSLLFLPSFMV